MASSSKRFPRAIVAQVLAELSPRLLPACATINPGCDAQEIGFKACGSFRRGLADSHDLDLVYVSTIGPATLPGEMFPLPQQSLVRVALAHLVAEGVLTELANGPSIQRFVHVATGLPVDCYAATHRSYYNVVLCRTGSKEHNVTLASAALALGLKWEPSARNAGFRDPEWHEIQIMDERHAFKCLGLAYKEPAERI